MGAVSGVKAWFLATRPWSFPMTFLSITFGSLMAAVEGFLNPSLYLLTLIGSILAHASANVLNDYFDTIHGVDTPLAPTVKYRPHPVLSGFTTPRKLVAFGWSLLFIASAIGAYLTLASGIAVAMLALLGFLLAVTYSGAPFKFKYKALGEPAVFFVWGPLMSIGAYYVQTSRLDWRIGLISAPLGLLVAAVLLANNLRDLDYDLKVGIRTLPVVIGRDVSLKVYSSMLIAPYLLVLLFTLTNLLPAWSLITLLSAPKAANLIRRFNVEIPLTADPDTAKLTLIFGLLLLLSLVADLILPL